MAKKKTDKLTADEQVEMDTMEANVVAQESAEADVVETAEIIPAALVDDEVAAQVFPSAPTAPALRLCADGRYEAMTHERDRTVLIDGVRYEHVSETADGRWVYARS